jgi:hypothetical protein
MPMPVAVFPRVRFETDEAFTTAQELGLDFHREPFGLEEFRKGMDMELVHGGCNLVTDVTHNDPVRTAKLVLAHLRGWSSTTRVAGLGSRRATAAAGRSISPSTRGVASR